jgi:hypothetical protein
MGSVPCSFRRPGTRVARSRSAHTVRNALQRRLLEIYRHGCAVDSPLHKVTTSRRVGEPDFHFLGYVLRDISLDVWHNGLIVAASR